MRRLIIRNEIIPFFYDLSITSGYKDKSIYDIYKTLYPLATVLKSVRTHYFYSSNNIMNESNVKRSR